MSGKILWVDDEIDLLKPHMVFLEAKGYALTPVNNVNEALEILEKRKNINWYLSMRTCRESQDWKQSR